MNRSHWSILNNEPINFRSINPYDQTRQILLAEKKHRRYNSQPNMLKEKPLNSVNNTSQFGHSTSHFFNQSKKNSSNAKKLIHIHNRTNSQQFIYNKWYIKPQFRMRKKQQFKVQLTEPQYSYQNLYAQNAKIGNDPLHIQKNKRVEFAQNFVFKQSNSINLLSQFKKRTQRQNKRVPKLVDLIVDLHNKKRKINNFFDQKYR